MDKAKSANIFNIPSNQHFFDSFLLWLENSFNDHISEVTILFPSQRSVREFNNLFLQHKLQNNSSIILPKVKTISNISYESFFEFLPNEEVKKIIDEILQIKVISDFDYLFLLSEEIKKSSVFGNKILPSQALNIAVSLKNLFDEIEKNQIDLKNINQIDDSNLSLHRQVNLDFLQEFYFRVKNTLIKKNTYFPASFHNFIIDKFCQVVEKFGLKFPLIIAGSSGSLLSGKKLIKATLSQNLGFVFLYGLDKKCVSKEEIHPQFIFNELINFIQIEKNKIHNFVNKKFNLSYNSRLDFLSSLYLPSSETDRWQENFLNNLEIKKDIEDNFLLIEAKNNLEEAELISFILAESIVDAKKCAVISNNDKLIELLKYQIEKLNINYNDSRNIGISNSLLINFIINVLEIIEGDFSSYNLSSLFKNSLFYNHQKQNLIYKFENKILRQDRVNDEISGIKLKLETLAEEDLSNFFNEFYQILLPIKNCEEQINLTSYINILIAVIEKLTAKTWENLLEEEKAQNEIFDFFEKLKMQNNFIIKRDDFLNLFKTLIKQVSYFEKSDSLSEIQILSTIEARLLNFDLVVVASLNEKDFPKIEMENWLGKKIRKDLGVDKKLRRIGQNAYDFCNYLSNKKVVLTRSLISEDSLSIASPFLLKFETLCKKLEISINKGEKYFEISKVKKSSQDQKIQQPNPKPKLENRVQKLAITDISKLLSDPYSIYAKRILKLKNLQELDFEPSYAEFGSFIHKSLEEFIKNPNNKNEFLEKAKEIFSNYFCSERSKLIWWPKFEEIFEQFLEQEKQLEFIKNYTEIAANLEIKNVSINGKIDRAAFDKNNFVSIYDYKTGQIPSDASVFSGFEPQLTISALMLIEGVLEKEIANISDDKINSLNYWKLSSSSDSKIKNVCDDNEKIKLLAASAKFGLEKLIEHFNQEKNGYISTPNPDNYDENEYTHLARVKEWI